MMDSGKEKLVIDWSAKKQMEQRGNRASKFIIRVNDTRKTFWDMFIIVIALWNCVCIPLQICFDPEQLDTAGVNALNNFIDLCFVADIIVCLRTTFYDSDTGDEVFNGKRTAMNYIRSSRFAIDVISTIPLDTLGFLITQKETPALQVFSLLKLVRITRITAIIGRLNTTS